MHYQETKFGFEWGSAKITRCFSDEANGWVTLLIETPKYPNSIQVYVTKTGKVRIHDSAGEWKPPRKKASKDRKKP